MADLADGESVSVQGSGRQPYVLKNHGGVYSCSCPAWRNQSNPPERRTCKHLRALRGEAAEAARVGAPAAGVGAVAAGAAPAGFAAGAAPAGATPAGFAAGAAPAAASAGAATVTPPPLLLAHTWDSDVDLTGWWLSEKLDGVRAYWDGTGFLSRLGNRYHAPAWFCAGLPAVPLDGELWVGRRRFQRTVSIVRRQDQSDDWREVRFLIFDAPALATPFEDRLRYLEAELARLRPAHAAFHEHQPCQGEAHLRAELARVEALGGEGLMLRRPGSRYEVGRSHTLLKVKSFHDAEARVVSHLPGTGRHKGRLGALLCEMPDGTQFAIGTGLSDAERRQPPPIGSLITYRYQELSDGGVPRFPSYVGVRHDAVWP